MYCTYRVCEAGGGTGLSQIRSCHKVPFQVTFRMTTFCIAFCESYLSTLVAIGNKKSGFQPVLEKFLQFYLAPAILASQLLLVF